MNYKEFNEIKLPNNLKKSVKTSIKKGYKEKKIIKRTKKYKTFAASIALAMGCGIIALNNESAMATINEIKISLSSLFSKESNAKDYIYIYDNTVTNNGIAAKIHEVLFDGSYIKINSSFTVPPEMLEGSSFKGNPSISEIDALPSVSINGSKVEASSSLSSKVKDNTIQILFNLSINDYTDEFLKALNETGSFLDIDDVFKILDSNENANLEISLNHLRIIKDISDENERNKESNNNFKFNINVPLKDLSTKTKIVNINKDIEVEHNEVIDLIKVIDSPSSIKLLYSEDKSSKKTFKNFFYRFNIYDENNNLLQTINSGGIESGGENLTDYGYTYIEYRKIKDTSKITLIPIYSYNGDYDENSNFFIDTYEIKEKSITINIK